ncbi:unnamed protein product [Aphanomyces euteiches]|nr:hypothetical protein AeRB84_005027 [Aphanomyces euteiches]
MNMTVRMLALSLLQAVAHAQVVSQVHLGLTTAAVDCPHGISVAFASDKATPWTVEFTDGDCTNAVESQVHRYELDAYTSPYLHEAVLSNMPPTTQFSYEIGSFESSFVTPPQSPDTTVLGVVGDIAMVNDAFDNLMTPVPSVGINGNHETDVASDGFVAERYLGYVNRANTPITQDDAANLRTYYSIDIGLIHCVFLDDQVGSSFKAGSPAWLAERQVMADWFTVDLDRVDRQETPYVVVFKHNPFYNTFDDHQCQCSPTVFEILDKDACWEGEYVYASTEEEPACGLQAKLEDIYAHFKVDVVVSGHVHGYERTDYIYQNEVNHERGSVYVTTGSGGRSHIVKNLTGDFSWSLFKEGLAFGATRIIATPSNLRLLWFANDDLTTPRDAATLYPRFR